MIYLKRIVNADITRQIDLNKETSLSFFGFDPENDSDKYLMLKDEQTTNVYSATIRKTGHSITITGAFSSFIREMCSLDDIVVFKSTQNQYKFLFTVVATQDKKYYHINEVLQTLGSRSSVLNTATHLLIVNDYKWDRAQSLQQIFFGAPGTSKSTRIKEEIGEKEQHRITFHPDTDYASFVGCYKPTQVEDSAEIIYNVDELHARFIDESSLFPNRPEHRFAAKYSKSFGLLSNEQARKVFQGISTESTVQAETPKLMASTEEFNKKNLSGGSISYKFVAQTFVKAYVSAWKKFFDSDESQKDVFLVIEEINRGNCAQIFGDLFQLLDRNSDGYSDYTIEPDSDLSRYLKEEFKNSNITVETIKNGDVMQLPPNLYIWATMNTSDQSLFPIDSAFKRRWDWKYTPIKNAHKGHMIQLKDRQYDWWEFLEAVNKRIEKVTESEDKQMGYWFAKPEKGVTISAEKFVSKVIFYLWNDVFKDYGHDVNSPFVIKQDDAKKKELRFKSFFDDEGEVDESVLILFFWGLKLEPKSAVAPSAAELAEVPATEEELTLVNLENTEEAKNSVIEDSSAIATESDYDEDENLPEATNIDDFFN